MITKNFKTLLYNILSSSGGNTGTGLLEVKSTSGNVRYVGTKMGGFPKETGTVVVFSPTGVGICLGTGNTSPSENDYKLDSMITSGLTASTPAATYGIDANSNPYVTYVFTASNSTNADIVVKEIGYIQSFYVSTSQGAYAGQYDQFLLDRSLLESPLTIPANSSAAIKYELKTIIPQ